MLDACQKRADAKGARDAAMITLMAYGALRCNETLSLDCRHVSIDAREVEVLSKGLWGRSRHPIPIVAAEAIETWLAFRGVEDGPLFVTLNHADVGDGKRLTYWGAYSAIRKLGKEVGVQVSPHKFRHFAATEHLRLTNGNVAWAMAMTRHRDPKTLMIYNDERMTRAREAMELVASGIPHYRMKA
jgi:integrase/recombinase XerC